jgi:hypothetical protein
VGDIDLKVISGVENSTKFQKISWKRDQTWVIGRGHTSIDERRTIFAEAYGIKPRCYWELFAC